MNSAGAAEQILELYPRSGTTRALNGTYLSHELQMQGTPGQPFVYANFVSSLDGRIAVVEADTGESYVLEDLTSSHDWRLFQELQAQADCMVTHSGYLRALGKASSRTSCRSVSRSRRWTSAPGATITDSVVNRRSPS